MSGPLSFYIESWREYAKLLKEIEAEEAKGQLSPVIILGMVLDHSGKDIKSSIRRLQSYPFMFHPMAQEALTFLRELEAKSQD